MVKIKQIGKVFINFSLVFSLFLISFFAVILKNKIAYADTKIVKISTARQLYDFARNVNNNSNNGEYRSAKVYLLNDIDMSTLEAEGKTFPTIGYRSNKAFTGVFDGQHHAIKNLKVSNINDLGLFGNVNGIVKNIILVGGSITANGGYHAGGIVGDLRGGKIFNCINLSCQINISNSKTSYTGGIAGEAHGGEIVSCRNDAKIFTFKGVSGDDVSVRSGGIIGYIRNDTVSIKGCHNTGVVDAGSTNNWTYAGGIAGRTDGGTIEHCLNDGKVKVYAKYDSSSSTINSMSGVGSDKKEMGTFDYVEKDKPSGKDAKKETKRKYAYIGGIAGYQKGGTISYCINTDTTDYSSRGGYNLYKYTLYYKLHNGYVGGSYDTYFYMYFTLRVNYYNALVGFKESGTLSNCYHPNTTSKNRSKVEVTYYEFEWDDTYLGEKRYSDGSLGTGSSRSMRWQTYKTYTSPQLGFIQKPSDAQIYTIVYEGTAAGADNWKLYTMSCPGTGEQWVDSTKIQEPTDMSTITNNNTTIWGYNGSTPIIKQFNWGDFAIEPSKAKCRECGNVYKDNIATCPNCGAPTS